MHVACDSYIVPPTDRRYTAYTDPPPSSIPNVHLAMNGSIPNVPLTRPRLPPMAIPRLSDLTHTLSPPIAATNHARPPARDQMKPLLTGLAGFLDLCYCFHSFAIYTAAVWVNTTSALSADN